MRTGRTRGSAAAALALAAFITSGAVLAAPAQETDVDPKIIDGRALTAAFFDNRMSELFERFSDAMKGAIPDVATLEGFRTQVESQLGAETEVVSEEMLQQDGMDVYLRKSKFTNTGDMLIATTFATSADGTIEGFSIRPDQGGNLLVYELAVRNERDEPLELVAVGITVDGVHDGIPENVPGIASRAVEITMETVAGNHVVLDLGNGRYALYAHFQPGSIRVAEGDRVAAGDVLGLAAHQRPAVAERPGQLPGTLSRSGIRSAIAKRLAASKATML